MSLYAAKASSETESDLYTLNPDTAVATSLGPIGHAITGLAFDPTTGTLYGSSSPNNGDVAKRRSLFTINPTTGAGTFIAQLNGTAGAKVMSDIAFDSTGQLYGYSGETNHLYRINKADASYVDLGLGGLGVSNAVITFGPADVLYMVARVSGSSALYTVNPADGTPTLVTVVDPAESRFFGAASYGSDGLIWLMKTSGYRLCICTTDGHFSVVVDSTTDPGFNFDALTWSVGGGPPPKIISKIKFGTGLKVTDEGDGVIRVDVL